MKDFRIDRENKTFVFDDGEVIPIPKDKEKKVLRSESGKKSKAESILKWQQYNERLPGETGHTILGSASESLLGNPIDTLTNYGVSGIKAFNPGEGQEGMGYVDRVLDHFYAMQEGRKEYLGGLQEKNPIASTIGKGIGTITELGLLSGVPGAVAFPLMGAGQSETSFLEPTEKLKEVGSQAAEGVILDKFFKGLSKVAGNRGSQRDLKKLIAETEQKNAGEIARAAGATEAEKLRFANQSAARQSELANIEKAQQAENNLFKSANNSSMDRVSRTIGRHPLSNEILGVEDFINKAIDTSSYAASPEGNFASKFLRTIFKGDKNGKITGESLSRGVKALDEAIIKNEGAVKQILIDYKTSLNQSLPNKLASNYVFEKWAPKIESGTNQVQNKLSDILFSSKEANDFLRQKLGKNYVGNLNNSINQEIKNVISRFKGNLQEIDGKILRDEINNAIRSLPEYKRVIKNINSMFPGQEARTLQAMFPDLIEAKTFLQNYPEILSEKISNNANKYKIDIANDFFTKGGVSEKALQKSPVSPNLIPQPPPVPYAQIIQPNLTSVPTIPEPRGMYEKLASGLESLREGGVKSSMNAIKENVPGIALAKFSGLPLAKVAAGGAAVATGARALTSPSVAGNALRTGLEQGARVVSLIDNMAQKYPSYNEGIVDDPQERRSLTKEIENNREMSLEEKAVYQSKINRGIPLQQRL